MSPNSPVPVTAARSTPRSLASLRTGGVDRGRSADCGAAAGSATGAGAAGSTTGAGATGSTTGAGAATEAAGAAKLRARRAGRPEFSRTAP